jgi:precorrin-6A/cobalt-precorrin-6A reductase
VILILGGTAEARELAGALHGRGVDVLTSLAGRVAQPRLPAGETRIGGFGGPAALADWLRANEITAVVDATHPFAERISGSAAVACGAAKVPLLRLERRGWSERPGDRWKWVDGLDGAAAAIGAIGAAAPNKTGGLHGPRVLLTTGRQGLATFADIDGAWFLIRCVDPPQTRLPPHHLLILDRGPYRRDAEGALLDQHRIDLVVTKDSGGTHTEAKLDAARDRSLPVIVVRRPPRPDVADTAADVPAALRWALDEAHAG